MKTRLTVTKEAGYVNEYSIEYKTFFWPFWRMLHGPSGSPGECFEWLYQNNYPQPSLVYTEYLH